MNAEQILDALGKVNETYVEEAVSGARKKKSPVWLRWGAAAACLCLCAVGILQLWNPGMGKDSQISSLAVEDGNLYYSVCSKGGYYWNENMKKPKRLLKGDAFVQTSQGLVFVSFPKNAVYQIEGAQLTKIGAAGVKDLLKDPVLIDIQDGFAYWKGEESGEANDLLASKIVCTNLETGEAETLVEGEVISAQTMRENTLYYEAKAQAEKKHRIAAYDVLKKQETILYEFPEPKDGNAIWNQVYFAKDAIILQREKGLYTLSYQGGTPQYLTQQIPITAAFDSDDGKIYFETAFNVNREPDEGEGTRESLVSVDLETGRLHELAELTKNGTAAYTYTKICVAENGYYFTDPQKGLFYHRFADESDIQITKD